MLDRVFLKYPIIAPELIGQYDFTELRAPVAKMIDADDIISLKQEYPFQRRANYGRPEMPDPERFGDIRR